MPCSASSEVAMVPAVESSQCAFIDRPSFETKLLTPRKAQTCWRLALPYFCAHAELMHANCCLEQVVVTFCVRLGLDPVFAPDVHAMPANEHGMRRRM